MKQARLLILFLMMLGSIAAYGQAVNRIVPQYHHWQRIYDGVLGDNGDGVDTTDAFSPLWWQGVITLTFATDTTGWDTPDSNMTVYMQLKRKYTYPGNQVVDQEWMGYYNDTGDKTLIDTVARSIVNRTGAFYMNPAVILSSTGEWAWADSIRFILQIGTGDSLGFTLDAGGQ